MERGFKYRIYPNESQRDQIARTFGCCRFVYNRALDVKKTAYSETGKSIATNDLIKMIPAWKRDPDTSWLAQVDSMALQQSIRDLDRAYKNFFRRVREGGNQVLCMEDLNAKGMMKNHHLAKAVTDASFGEFAQLLEYKCAERGRSLVKIGRFYPSSKTCSACGHRLDALPLSVRSWDCPACGAHHDRDVNAARNILTEGKRILSNTEGTAGHAGTAAAITA